MDIRKYALVCLLCFAADVAYACPLAPVSTLSTNAGVPVGSSLSVAYPTTANPDLSLAKCGWWMTEWQVATYDGAFIEVDHNRFQSDPAYKNTIFGKARGLALFQVSSKDFGMDVSTLGLDPARIHPGTRYVWRARIITKIKVMGTGEGVFAASPYSPTYSFETTYANQGKCTAMPKLTLSEPAHDSKNIPLQPVFRIFNSDAPLQAPCAWNETVIVVQESNSPSADVHQHTIKAPNSFSQQIALPSKLKPGTKYFWTASAVFNDPNSASIIQGDWAESRWITTQTVAPSPQPVPPPPPILPPPGGDSSAACSHVDEPIQAAPFDGAVTNRNWLELRLEHGGFSPGCTWDETTWQILDDETGEYVYQTGFTSSFLTRLNPPSDRITPGRTYYWRTKIVSRGTGPDGKDVYSDWTEGSRFISSE